MILCTAQEADAILSEAKLCTRPITHASGKEDMITAGDGREGGRRKETGKSKHSILVEVFVSNVGPRVFAGWCYKFTLQDGLHISFMIRPRTAISEEFPCRLLTDKSRQHESMECLSDSCNRNRIMLTFTQSGESRIPSLVEF